MHTILLIGFLSFSSAFVVPTNIVRQWGSCDSSLYMSAVDEINASTIKSRLESQMEKLREKDKTSVTLSSQDLDVVFEDEHIIVVNKPAGVLCVPGKGENPSLNEVVFDTYGCESGRMDKMVVHRLGMDTSGLIVFARTDEALRNMNTLFRTRKVTRNYEALLCGHVEKDEGEINLPIMRDYEFPPFMRISNDEHQLALVGLSSDDVGKKLLENPKQSLTLYKVLSREELGSYPVSRVSLTSVTGRTHQLNVHCAAFGHPIVGDKVYGINGEAAANGGLDEITMDEIAPNRASLELQQQIADAAAATGSKSMCVHAKSIGFRHPMDKKQDLLLERAAPF